MSLDDYSAELPRALRATPTTSIFPPDHFGVAPRSKKLRAVELLKLVAAFRRETPAHLFTRLITAEAKRVFGGKGGP